MTGSAATVATAAANTAYKGIAFAPTGQVLTQGPPTITLSDTGLSRSIGDTYAPDTVTATISDALFSADQLTVTDSVAAHPGDANVVSNVSLSGSGNEDDHRLVLDTVGLSDVTLHVSTPDGRSASATFQYGVSAPAPDATSSFLYGSGSNASAAIDVGAATTSSATTSSTRSRL